MYVLEDGFCFDVDFDAGNVCVTLAATGIFWFAPVLAALDVYKSRFPSRMMRSVVCTKLSLYALVLYLPVLNGNARVERFDFASFCASGCAGSARSLDKVLTHAVSMNDSRLPMFASVCLGFSHSAMYAQTTMQVEKPRGRRLGLNLSIVSPT